MTYRHRQDKALRDAATEIIETTSSARCLSGSQHVSTEVSARHRARPHYRTKEEDFKELLANVLDIRRKLARDPSNTVLKALERCQTARLQWLGELIASKDNYLRSSVSSDRAVTRSDRLSPLGRTERL